MDQRTAFDLLLDYPKKNGLVYETHESQQRFYLSPSDPLLSTKYIIFKKDNLFFCAYDSFAAKAYMSKTFTGLYGFIDLKKDFECRIYKKDWLDFFLRINKRKTGIKAIDDNLTITSKSRSLPKRLLSEKDLALFNKISNKITPVELLIQNNYLQIIKEFNDKKVIGIETNQWLYKNEDLGVFIDTGAELISNIMTAS
jgi:hypothetical protein